MSTYIELPNVPEGHTAVLHGRGEIFFRHHDAGPGAPMVVLLHGWTANADTQFFTAFDAIGERYSFIAVDHRGHGRGIRAPFTLEDAADDAAALIRHLGLGPVIALGYSMGGPIAALLARRHPDLVSGTVFQATALEWNSTWPDRLRWRFVGLTGSGLRSRWYRRVVRLALGRLAAENPHLDPLRSWLEGEMLRNDATAMVEAGRALSRYDATDWIGQLNQPVGVLLTTLDRLVAPSKQRALAAATGAEVVEVAGDHLFALANPVEYSRATRQLLDGVHDRVGTIRSSNESSNESSDESSNESSGNRRWIRSVRSV